MKSSQSLSFVSYNLRNWAVLLRQLVLMFGVHKILCSSSLHFTFQIEISVIRTIFVILRTFLQLNIVKKFIWVSQHSSKPQVYCESSFDCVVFKSCHLLKHQDQVCSKENKLSSSNQEAFPLVVKNNGEVLVPCLPWKCVPTAISGVDIPDVSCCHLLHQVSS